MSIFSFCCLLVVTQSFQFDVPPCFLSFTNNGGLYKCGRAFSPKPKYSAKQQHLSASFQNLAKEEIVGNFVPPSSYPSNDLSPLRCSLLGIYSTGDSEIGIGIPVEEPVHVFSLENKKLKFLSPAPIGQTIDDGSNDRYGEVINYISKQLEPYEASLTATVLFPTLQGAANFEDVDGGSDEGKDSTERNLVNEVDENAEEVSFEDVLERELDSLNSYERSTRENNEVHVSSPLSDAVVTEEDEKWLQTEADLVDRIISSFAVDVKYFASFLYKKKNYHILRILEVNPFRFLFLFLLFISSLSWFLVAVISLLMIHLSFVF
jgi:hypothetical protein